MANKEHLNVIKQGRDAWNNLRKQYPKLRADLRGADLRETDLTEADLREADLREADLYKTILIGANFIGANFIGANLSGANLMRANLSIAHLSKASLMNADLMGTNFDGAHLNRADLRGADLSRAYLKDAKLIGADLRLARLREADMREADLNGADCREADCREADFKKADLSGANFMGANLVEADLTETNLMGANLSEADLSGANLSGANLSGANLSGANLSKTSLVGTNLTQTTLKDCSIYGISAWDVELDGAEQLNLIITPKFQPTITVDNLKVAQFIYLLLNNAEIREVINTLTTKAVLIVGRFTPERKAVLDVLRDALRTHNYLPILFDFDPANTQTIRETVRTLAHLSHFIIADLTNPSSIPEELETVIPTLAIPVQPLLETTQKREFSMFKGYGVYPWVLPIYRYSNLEGLVNNLHEKVIEPATQKARELADKKVRLNQEPFEQIF